MELHKVLLARSKVFSKGASISFTLILLCRFHINQQIVINPLAPQGFCITNLKSNKGEKMICHITQLIKVSTPSHLQIFTTQ